MFSVLLSVFTCTGGIHNLKSICLGVHILSSVPLVDLSFTSDTTEE